MTTPNPCRRTLNIISRFHFFRKYESFMLSCAYCTSVQPLRYAKHRSCSRILRKKNNRIDTSCYEQRPQSAGWKYLQSRAWSLQVGQVVTIFATLDWHTQYSQSRILETVTWTDVHRRSLQSADNLHVAVAPGFYEVAD